VSSLRFRSGTSFISRRALFDRGVHRQLQAGIAGGEHAGTEIDCRLWRLRGRRRLRQRWPHEEPCRRASSSRSPRRASRLRFRTGDERRPSATTSPGRTLVGPSSSERGFDVVRCHYVPPSSTAPPCGAASSPRNRNRSFHSGSVGTEAPGATPIAQRGEVVGSKMPHLFAAFY